MIEKKIVQQLLDEITDDVDIDELEENAYEDDYYLMALRKLTNKKDEDFERKFLSEVMSLKTNYQGIEIHDYLFYNKII